MKPQQILTVVLITVIFLTVMVVGLTYAQEPEKGGISAAQVSLGAGFTYQGELKKSGQPITSTCEMAFRLYDDAGAGNQVGTAITTTVPVSSSLFTVNLDFGEVFTGTARWLGIKVKCGGDTNHADMGRQELKAAPYALYARSTGALQGRPITTTVPGIGQVLKWDGSAWTPTFTVCEAHAARPVFSLTTLDSDGQGFLSITIGADGLGLISYYDLTNTALRVAHCNDVACTGATLTTLDSAGDVGAYTSVTIGADGLGLISYFDGTNKDLKVAHCNDVACTSATLTTLDSATEAGYDTSMVIGADGLGLISYYDFTNKDLKVAHCNNVACTSATITTLDSAGDVGGYTSLTIGADGLGLISYLDNTNTALKVAHCNDVACTGATLTTLDSNDLAGVWTGVTIGSDGLGLIVYRDNSVGGDLIVAHCNNVICTGAITTTLDSNTAGIPGWSSITMGADGLGLVAYNDMTNHVLKVAHCNDVACTSSTLAMLDNPAGGNTSVTIGTDGLGLISYFGSTANTVLKVAHCSNIFCVPYFRRR